MGDLTISQVELTDEGTYTCRAANFYGKIEAEVKVEVIRKLKHRRTVSSDTDDVQEEVQANLGDDVVLKCDIEADSRVNVTTQWVKLHRGGRMKVRGSSILCGNRSRQ